MTKEKIVNLVQLECLEMIKQPIAVTNVVVDNTKKMVELVKEWLNLLVRIILQFVKSVQKVNTFLTTKLEVNPTWRLRITDTLIHAETVLQDNTTTIVRKVKIINVNCVLEDITKS